MRQSMGEIMATGADRPEFTRSAVGTTPAASTGLAERLEAPATTHNRVLLALPPEELALIAPHLERVTIAALEVLAEADVRLEHVFFPETAVVSAVRRTHDGTTIETGIVGREGMAGIAVILGSDWSPAVLMGQMPGTVLRMPIEAMRELLPALPALSDLLRRFALAFLDQCGQTIVCNSLHQLEQRCARWLLSAHDHVDGNELHLTHSVLAQMLAVRRAGVTMAALALQRAGLIRYSRGRIQIMDRAGLEAASCECYATVRGHLERLLPETV
jgi:CRP-like cAMP-binding protein